MHHLKHNTLEDSLMGHIWWIMMTEVKQGDGSTIGVSTWQYCELALAQLRLEGAATVVKEWQTFSYSEIMNC